MLCAMLGDCFASLAMTSRFAQDDWKTARGNESKLRLSVDCVSFLYSYAQTQLNSEAQLILEL